MAIAAASLAAGFMAKPRARQAPGPNGRVRRGRHRGEITPWSAPEARVRVIAETTGPGTRCANRALTDAAGLRASPRTDAGLTSGRPTQLAAEPGQALQPDRLRGAAASRYYPAVYRASMVRAPRESVPRHREQGQRHSRALHAAAVVELHQQQWLPQLPLFGNYATRTWRRCRANRPAPQSHTDRVPHVRDRAVACRRSVRAPNSPTCGAGAQPSPAISRGRIRRYAIASCPWPIR